MCVRTGDTAQGNSAYSTCKCFAGCRDARVTKACRLHEAKDRKTESGPSQVGWRQKPGAQPVSITVHGLGMGILRSCRLHDSQGQKSKAVQAMSSGDKIRSTDSVSSYYGRGVWTGGGRMQSRPECRPARHVLMGNFSGTYVSTVHMCT